MGGVLLLGRGDIFFFVFCFLFFCYLVYSFFFASISSL